MDKGLGQVDAQEMTTRCAAQGAAVERPQATYGTGQLSLDEAVERTKTQTHRLVRRQYNWFKLNDPRIRWLDASGSGVDQEATELVAAFLNADPPVIQ